MTERIVIRKTKKGFSFTLDNTFAVLIATVFLLTIAFISSQYENPYPQIVLEKQGNDVLAVLDNSGTLASMNSSLIPVYIDDLLPLSLQWNIQIDYYNYSNGFVHDSNLSFGSSYSQSNKLSVTQRQFLVYEKNNIKHYGLAKLILWTE